MPMLQPTTLAAEGPTFSRLVAGMMTWGAWGAKLSTKEMASLLEALVERGITTIDHADIYGLYSTEEDFGKALATVPHLKAKLQVVTKCGIQLPDGPFDHPHKAYHYSREYITQMAERSLKLLGVEVLDVLLLHRPSPLLHPDEAAEALQALMDQGKIKHAGVSNFTPSQFSMLRSRIPLVTNQVEASVTHLAPFQDGTFDQALELGLKPMAWSPIGGGTLLGDEVPTEWQRLKRGLLEVAESHQTTPDVIMLAWLLKHPSGMLPVLGSTKLHRWDGYLKALDIELSHYEWLRLWMDSMGEDIP